MSVEVMIASLYSWSWVVTVSGTHDNPQVEQPTGGANSIRKCYWFKWEEKQKTNVTDTHAASSTELMVNSVIILAYAYH